MKRSKKIVIVSHCLLNANTIIYPMAEYPGVFSDFIREYMDEGCGFLQLPCPETTYLGINRWGMTREQYDMPAFRRHCRQLLQYPLDQIRSFIQARFEIVGVYGVKGSPSCGVTRTCSGYQGGQIVTDRVKSQIDDFERIPGPGVFMSVFMEAALSDCIPLKFFDAQP